ncbi:sensor histidine kinase [Streptomyces sp. NPDC059072]|uniref:sensor histidine kinase n=1 Tax=unclassified Streptomyces TaxID=2593676 RepID=UPI0036A49E32
MPAIARLAGRGARRRLPRRTVRLRMTLLYGGLFVLSGAALLGVTYVLVLRAIGGRPPELSINEAGTDPGAVPAQPPQSRQSALKTLAEQAQDAMAGQISDTMHQLLVQSGIALALMLVVSIVLGWIVAGRMLRPLRTITATAQEISATSLHQRLALEGPPDELKELGDTFDGLLSRLETSFEAHRQFVANASHELRTPLARQRALGQVALSDPEATVESLRQAHERILAAGAQQERLIGSLLTLARSQGGIDVREPFDLARLTAEVVESRKGEAHRRAVTFRTSITPAVAAGHRTLAEGLVANLVDNALRYNVLYGHVEVATRTVDGRAALIVGNTGPLVPPSAIEQLFQPFQQLGVTRAARTEGLGLGLSIVQAIAHAHDADLTTRARSGGGLTIIVTFPAIPRRASLPGPA